MNNQKQYNNFTYNTKCNIWRISFKNKDKEFNLKDYCSDDYNITVFNNSKTYKGICINQLNMFYGELCTMYYVWKNNLKSDIVGFDQYSRQWASIDFNKLNDNKIQTFFHGIDTQNIILKDHANMGNFFYLFLVYINMYFPEYSFKLNNIAFDKETHISDYINIFICKWEIFDKICKVIFGFLEYIMPDNKWQNPNVINKYIEINTKYSYMFDPTNWYYNCSRHICLLFEVLFGTIYNLINTSYQDDKLERYSVVYTCNNNKDYENILKIHKYNIGNGIFYVFLKDPKNIFLNKSKGNIYHRYLYLYDNLYNIKRDEILKMINYVPELYHNKILINLNSDEYIYSDSSIELNKGNYKIKKINDISDKSLLETNKY